MLKRLTLVRGGVAKKDFQPLLTFFHIYEGRIQGTNGRLTIDASCEQLKGIEATVHCIKFLKAVDACNGEPNIKITAAGNMMVSKNSFRARLPLGEHEKYPRTTFQVDLPIQPPPENFIQVLKRLQPFMGEDATRPWMNAVHFKDGFAYATNNPVMVRVWVGDCPNMTLPGFLVDELIRLALIPESLVISENNIFVQFKEEVWIRSSTLDGSWPLVGTMLDNFHMNTELVPIPHQLKEVINQILPFCPNPKFPEIILNEKGVSTGDGDMEANVEGISFPECKWHAENLLLVLSEASKIDFTKWPKPCPWLGDGIQGVLVGLKD